MTRLISRAEAWEKAYEAFNQINFTAFDYNSIKQSIVDYLKLYFPESFNDFIESSEFIAIIEVFAYLGELLIYRVDVSSHENFMGVAQRKQNVLRLAKLISYKTSRNVPARGLLKITSIASTEDLYDTRGNSLKGKRVVWNDINNLAWKEQFLAILNAATVSNIGTVNPNDRVQVDNVLFELYSLNNLYPQRGVLPYTINVNGGKYDMEIVPVQIDEYGPSERRPELGSSMTLLYGADGFGNDSPTTGFFFFTKQGSLTSVRRTFDGKTPNQYIDLTDTNINDTDLWINNIDPQTEQILNDGAIRNKRSGEWEEVDTTNAENVIFSYSTGRNRFETETLENDQVRIAFGDGEFADIPSGVFDIWYRRSANEDISIPMNAVVDKEFTLTYTDKQGQNQTLRFTVSFISNIQNATASEDTEHIRRVAPAVYYSQNRMVNGADYNLFPLKDPSILKLRTINRTYVGESKYSNWHDASSTYENVKIVGDDLTLTYNDYIEVQRVDEAASINKLFANYIVPILSSVGFYAYRYARHYQNLRRSFTASEVGQIKDVLSNNTWPDPVWITYDVDQDLFRATTTEPESFMIQVDGTTVGGQLVAWVTSNQASNLIVESPTTKFWSVNGNVNVPYDTLVPARDTIEILKANVNKYEKDSAKARLLTNSISLAVKKAVHDASGLQDVHKLEVLSYSENNSSLSGITLIGDLVDPVYHYRVVNNNGTTTANAVNALSGTTPSGLSTTLTITLPFQYMRGMNEFTITGVTSTSWQETEGDVGSLTNTVYINVAVGQEFSVVRFSFVYYQRADVTSAWVLMDDDQGRSMHTIESVNQLPAAQRKCRRARGRSNLNFMWMHKTSMYRLVDPSHTNIIDAFVIQKGYYNNLQDWLTGVRSQPIAPTPLQLRNDYKEQLVNAMISDTVVFHPGKIKLVFGSKAASQLQAKLLVVKNSHTMLTDSQIKLKVRNEVRKFFDITYWEFGETFYFTELSAIIHKALASDINSVVLVPLYPNHYFGDLFQVNMSEDEIVQADIDIEDIDITAALNAVNINQIR